MLALFSITIKNNSPKKCPRKFTQGKEFSWTKNVHENSWKKSRKIHPLKMSTKIHPFWKKVSIRIHCPPKVSIPTKQTETEWTTFVTLLKQFRTEWFLQLKKKLWCLFKLIFSWFFRENIKPHSDMLKGVCVCYGKLNCGWRSIEHFDEIIRQPRRNSRFWSFRICLHFRLSQCEDYFISKKVCFIDIH